MKKYLPIFLLAALISCQPKTVAENGGLIIDISLDINTDNTLLDSTVNVLQNRINSFCDNPTVIVSADKKTIQINLPGVFDSTIYKNTILKKGNFEIVECYELEEIFPNLATINNKLVENKNYGIAIPTDTGMVGETPIINPLFGILQIKTVEGGLQKGPEIGNVNIKDTALISTILHNENFYYDLPRDIDFKWSTPISDDFVALLGLKKPKHQAAIISEMIADAKVVEGNIDDYVVNFSLKEYYHSDWAYFTRENINRSIAILVDNILYSYPRVYAEIKGGNSEISSTMTEQEAKALAAILKYGVIPINLQVTKMTIVPKP